MVTSENLSDLLPKIQMELIANDSGMAGTNFNDVMKCTRLFLKRVWEKLMSLSAKKLELFMTEIVFAGLRVGTEGVHADNIKLTAIVDWHQPPDLLNLSSFLGLAGYFQDLIKGYAKMALPLTDLVHGTSIPKTAGKAAYRTALRKVKLPNVWNSTHQSAFTAIKVTLTSDPVLKAPHFNGTPFIVMLDRCKEEFSAMLAQRFTETRKGGKSTANSTCTTTSLGTNFLTRSTPPC